MRHALRTLALSAVSTLLLAGAAAADPGTKVALVPGGPHPYFSAWEQAGKDAVEYRREMFRRADAKRHLAALNLAVAKSDWGKPTPEGMVRAVAVFECFGTVVAQIAEVTMKNDVPRVGRTAGSPVDL